MTGGNLSYYARARSAAALSVQLLQLLRQLQEQARGAGPAGFRRRAHLDASALSGDVDLAALDPSADHPGDVQERALHLNVGLRGGLAEEQPVVPGKRLALCQGDLAILQVRLVAHQHDDRPFVGISAQVLEPAVKVLKARSPRHVVDEESSGSTAVIGPCDGLERLLPSGVPDLELDGDLVYNGVLHAELDAYRQVVVRLEALVRELREQARLPDAHVADDDVLELVCPRRRRRRT
mmetsp:Transcript_68944/g.180711  ORF Transcript_68944/g.180711 Transcript_68944/m.180711 type:complete len:237 (+) Transcript_68944:229-939(+)